MVPARKDESQLSLDSVQLSLPDTNRRQSWLEVALDKALSYLRDAEWLTAERARAYSKILFFVTIVGAAVWIALSRNGIDPAGKPLGTDFVSFWTASELTLHGRPDLVYNIGAHFAAQKALFGPHIAYTAFFYPPTYLLICLPLAAIPYFWSLAAWLALTGAAYWRALREYLPKDFEAIALFAYPAFLINIGHGQNGFLTGALMGGGLLLMNRRPAIAGLCFGALTFKPHLALVLPIALIFSRRWKPLAVAAISALALSAVSWLAFGTQTWKGFLGVSALARATLEQNLVGDEKMQSVFAAVRLLHGDLVLAYGLQGAVAAGVIAMLFYMQRHAFRSPGEAPAVAVASLLASPFLLDYDLTLLAFPLAWLFREARRTGFLRWEKSLLLFSYALPLISRLVAGSLALPLGPPTMIAVFVLVLRRSLMARENSFARDETGTIYESRRSSSCVI